MITERSAGIIPFNTKTKRFLLLHYPAGHWGFPKGHIEEGETDIDAAKREMKEETGLSCNLLFGFKSEISYFYKKDGKLSHKTVVFFIGTLDKESVKLSFEHDGYKWISEKEKKEITYENERKVFERAIEFLRSSGLI